MPVPAKLPLGSTSFEDLRRAGKIYVDKTSLIFDLACLSDPLFLSRPRRFGKSLLLSTFESLFTHGTEYFKGLEIESRWEEVERGRTYKAIHLDFSSLNYQNVAELDAELCLCLKESATLNHLELNFDLTGYKAGGILKLLVKTHPSELILLIDEYDYPLTHALEDKTLFEEYRKYLQGFFGAVKSICGSLRFFFITGVGRFAKTSIFSQLNNLNDLTLNGEYATLLGYTDDEVHRYFGEYVKDAALELKLTESQLYAELKAHYDGYRMTVESDKTVYAPWSVLNFLRYAKRGFLNYWYESGGAFPTLVIQYLKTIQSKPWEGLQKVRITKDQLADFCDYFEVPPAALLYQTGYLTVRTEPNGLGGERLFLAPPNLEVKSALTKLSLVKNRTPAPGEHALDEFCSSLYNNLKQQNHELLIKTFDAILNTCGYDNREAFASEAYVRDLIYLILTVTGLNSSRELYSAKGRADLAVELPERSYIIEFKLARGEGEEEKLLQEAVNQLTDKRYGEILPEKPTVKLAVVVSAIKKSVARWQLTK